MVRGRHVASEQHLLQSHLSIRPSICPQAMMKATHLLQHDATPSLHTLSLTSLWDVPLLWGTAFGLFFFIFCYLLTTPFLLQVHGGPPLTHRREGVVTFFHDGTPFCSWTCARCCSHVVRFFFFSLFIFVCWLIFLFMSPSCLSLCHVLCVSPFSCIVPSSHVTTSLMPWGCHNITGEQLFRSHGKVPTVWLFFPRPEMFTHCSSTGSSSHCPRFFPVA